MYLYNYIIQGSMNPSAYSLSSIAMRRHFHEYAGSTKYILLPSHLEKFTWRFIQLKKRIKMKSSRMKGGSAECAIVCCRQYACSFYLEVVVMRVIPMYSSLYYIIIYNNIFFVIKEGIVLLISSRTSFVLNARIWSSEERSQLDINIYLLAISIYIVFHTLVICDFTQDLKKAQFWPFKELWQWEIW